MFTLLNKLLRLNIERLSVRPDTSCDRLYQCIRSIQEGSNLVTSWSLTIVGGTLLTILSNEYLQTNSQLVKYIYLLYIPAWIILAVSLYHGRKLTAKSIASDLFQGDRPNLLDIFESCNHHYGRQLSNFNRALTVLGLWLILYLLWWVFGDDIINNQFNL